MGYNVFNNNQQARILSEVQQQMHLVELDLYVNELRKNKYPHAKTDKILKGKI